MPTELLMPKLSESMEEGTILKWLVEEGGQARSGEPLVEIETDKANTTYDAEGDARLIEILAKEGQTVAVGQPIARIDDLAPPAPALGAKGEVAVAAPTRLQQNVSRRVAESKATAPDYT